jgi:hypothetical protein
MCRTGASLGVRPQTHGPVPPRAEPPTLPPDGHGRGYPVGLLALLVVEPPVQGEGQLLLGLAVRVQDGDRLEAARVGVGLGRPGGLALLGQVAVAVAVHVQRVPVEHEPDAVVGLGAEDEQGVFLGLGLVRRLHADRAIHFGQVGSIGVSRRCRGQAAQDKDSVMCPHVDSSRSRIVPG